MSKLVVITGANTGLGFETAKNLLELGYQILMGNRSEEKSIKAIEKLEEMGFNKGIDFIKLDLENRQSIENFVEEFKKRDLKIDVLINNAGVLLPKYSLSENSLEKHFDINFLGHFYLNYLLYPYLEDDALVVSLGSLSHKMNVADINFKDLNLKNRKYNKMEAYAQSKLALTLFGVELARGFEGSGKRSVVVHPGVCNTDIVGRYFFKPLFTALRPLVSIYGIKGPKEGVKSIVYAIVEEDIPNGSYIGPMGKREHCGEPGFAKLSAKALDEKLAKRLWEKAEELLGIRFRNG